VPKGEVPAGRTTSDAALPAVKGSEPTANSKLTPTTRDLAPTGHTLFHSINGRDQTSDRICMEEEKVEMQGTGYLDVQPGSVPQSQFTPVQGMFTEVGVRADAAARDPHDRR
jgi:hypothetical protein